MARVWLVTGGTATLGRAVVRQAAEDHHQVRVLSRQPRPADADETGWVVGDLHSGDGLDDAVRDVHVVVHCATGTRRQRDVHDTTNLLAALRAVDPPPHLIYVSIVGIDEIRLGYYRMKLEVEHLVESSALPWTILRATQFHDLVYAGCGLLSRSPVMVVPAATSYQPVDVRDVAARLLELGTGPPAGRVADLGGPEVLTTRELARAFLRATGRRRAVVPVLLPGRAFADYRRGAQLTPEHADGRRTFAAYCHERADR